MSKHRELQILKRSQERIAMHPYSYNQQRCEKDFPGCLLVHHAKSASELNYAWDSPPRVLPKNEAEFSSLPIWAPDRFNVTAADAVEFLQKGIDNLEMLICGKSKRDRGVIASE